MSGDGDSRAQDPWLTIAEIAEELRCSPATIRSWISNGTLRAMRPGQRKLLVRRSDLDRMLRGDDFADSADPSADPTRAAPRLRPPDSTSSLSWPAGDAERIDPEDWLGTAQWEWLAALSQSQMAPPDAWFAGRLAHIGEAAARKADALGHFADDEEIRWDGEPSGSPYALAYELRPGGNRPGPRDLWARFDVCVKQLGDAEAAGRAGVLRGALEELSVALHDLADSLGRYRGPYGEWREPPPSADDDVKRSNGVA